MAFVGYPGQVVGRSEISVQMDKSPCKSAVRPNGAMRYPTLASALANALAMRPYRRQSIRIPPALAKRIEHNDLTLDHE